MGLFKKKEEVREEESTAGVLLEAILRGVSVDRDTALSIPVISGYVDLICNTFAMIPFKLYKETITDGKRTTEEIADNRVKFINDDTTDTLDGFQACFMFRTIRFHLRNQQILFVRVLIFW